MCFDFLYKFVWNVSNSKKNWTRYDKKNVCSSSCKVPVILVGSEGNLKYSLQFFEEYWNLNLLKIRPVGAELFYADRRTDGRIWRR